MPRAPSLLLCVTGQRQGMHPAEQGLPGTTTIFHFPEMNRIPEHIFRASSHQKDTLASHFRANHGISNVQMQAAVAAPSPVIKGFLSFICKIALLITADNYSLIMALLVSCSYHAIFCSGFVTSLLVKFAAFG